MNEDKELVLAHYPHADLEYNRPIAGADLPHDRDGHWAVYKFRELGTELLGIGATEAEAWAAAAEKIRKNKKA